MSISTSTNVAPSIRFDLAELELMNNALNEILNGPGALENWEFQTRTGASVEEAQALLAKLDVAIEELSGGPTNHSTRTR